MEGRLVYSERQEHMLTRSRVATAITVILIGTCISARAYADGFTGYVGCGKHPQPGCSVGAGSSSTRPGSSGTQSSHGSGKPGECHDPRGRRIPCQRNGGWAGGDGCYYKPTSPSASTVDALGGQPAGEGAWYQRTCYAKDGTTEEALGAPVWLRSAPVISPEVVAHQAVSRLSLPGVSISLSPSRDQLVGLPTWMWLSGGSWGRSSATAAVPHVRVTATAVPTKAVWDMGDGTRPVVCRGPGSVWRKGMSPRAASPDCGFTYRSASEVAPGGVYTVRVSVSWQVSWQGAGKSGTVPGLVTVGTRRVRVAESQTVVTR